MEFSLFDAVIVDLDGTMVDTLDDFVVALNLMLDELALPRRPQMQRAEVEALVGKGSEHLIESALELVEPGYLGATSNAPELQSSARFTSACAIYQRHYDSINGRHANVYPGVHEGLKSFLDGGKKLACLTNKPYAFAMALLRQKNLDGYFSAVFGGDSFARKKPDPLPLLKTCAALGCAPGRTLMLGDSSNDAQAARSAGCPVVLVTYGYNHGQPLRCVDADGFVDSLAEFRHFTGGL